MANLLGRRLVDRDRQAAPQAARDKVPPAGIEPAHAVDDRRLPRLPADDARADHHHRRARRRDWIRRRPDGGRGTAVPRVGDRGACGAT